MLCFNRQKKKTSPQPNNEEGIPIKPIKVKRNSSDNKAKENKDPAPAEQSPKRKEPAANKAPAEPGKTTKKGPQKTVDLDKGKTVC